MGECRFRRKTFPIFVGYCMSGFIYHSVVYCALFVFIFCFVLLLVAKQLRVMSVLRRWNPVFMVDLEKNPRVVGTGKCCCGREPLKDNTMPVPPLLKNQNAQYQYVPGNLPISQPSPSADGHVTKLAAGQRSLAG